MNPQAGGSWVALALLSRVWGRRGELSAVSMSDKPERFSTLREVCLFGADGAPMAGGPLEVESVWQHRDRLIFKFRGVDSISDAERLAGAEVRIPLAERAPLGEDEYYQSDLVGCEVIDRRTGARLGVVKAWEEYGGPPLLSVEGGAAPLLIPFARTICTGIDVAGRRIEVELPEGLADLSGR